MDRSQVYSLTEGLGDISVINHFTKTLSSVAYNLGLQLRPFNILNTKEESENGLLDIAEFQGMLGGTDNIFNEVAKERMMQLQGQDVYFGEDVMVDIKETMFYDYLLSSSICYIEFTKLATNKSGVQYVKYEKFLATRNTDLIANWLGISKDEAYSKYAERVESNYSNLWCNSLRVAKLVYKNDEHSVSIPRNPIQVMSIRCVPLFCLNAFMLGVSQFIKTGILKFTYYKDNGTLRELTTTLNNDIYMKFYKDTNWTRNVMNNCGYYSMLERGQKVSKELSRGYVRLPELGASKYDLSGNRTVNLGRIVKIEKLEEKDVDTSYINVDLNSATKNFIMCVDYLVKALPQEIKPMAIALTNGTFAENATVSNIQVAIESWVLEQEAILTTQFRRALHKFMVSNPLWFPNYTGLPAEGVTTGGNLGVC